MTQAKSTSKMTFDSPEFVKAIESLGTRSTNLNTATQRSSTTGMNDFNNSQRSAVDTANYALSTNPLVQRSQYEDSRNFTEDSRRFDAGLNFKNTADQRANDTSRFGISANLEGNKYVADAGVRSTGLQADASKYSADRGVDATRLQADASRYGADRGVDQARIGATAQVDSARIGADANRFNALLGAGTTFFNSSQYRPTFNR